MSWWDIADLTPIAAWDATRVNTALDVGGAKILDGVGGYHLLNAGVKERSSERFYVKGTNNTMPFPSPITFPVNYAVAVFVNTNSRYVSFHKDVASGYMLDRENTSNVYFNNTTTTYLGAYKEFGKDNFLLLAVTASGGLLYQDGALISGTIPLASIPPYISGHGWTGNGNEYNFDTSDKFFGGGVWAGTVTLAKVQEIEAALRAAIDAPVPHRILVPASYVPFPMRGAPRPAFDSYRRDAKAHTRRLTGAGLGMVSGTIREDGAPAEKYVRIFERQTHAVRGGKWSRADGTYEFGGLDETLEYYVLVFDGNRVYPAQIQDQVYFPGP